MTVYKNMAFGLSLQKMPKDEIDRKVHEVAKILDLEHLLNRKPKALSGGQRQRVALGRAMVRDPDVFLLDEPLSNLDAKLRTSMRAEIARLHKRLGTTFVYVTHDQKEALTMADRIMVMNRGKVEQIGSPSDIYTHPRTLFVADFIGESNLLRGTMIHDELVEFAGTEFPCVDFGFGENTPVDVVVRPEDIMLVGEDVGQMVGTIKSVLFKGVHYEMMIDTGAYTFKVHSTTMQPQGSRVGLNIVPFNIHIMKRLEDTTPAAEVDAEC